MEETSSNSPVFCWEISVEDIKQIPMLHDLWASFEAVCVVPKKCKAFKETDGFNRYKRDIIIYKVNISVYANFVCHH